ncbi:MAG: hypothetical protein COC19_06700 [SAR86 cluster bacterium]|uniref:DUF6351 domain-containing protein n=1 Tax=SAR86 cluster bacterium TaxID=2030880 RepID=A0A2A4MJ59_9GAMM|nr:MAG: hypothetical protein COC19_06700 [SAR86 cluster bacterium]
MNNLNAANYCVIPNTLHTFFRKGRQATLAAALSSLLVVSCSEQASNPGNISMRSISNQAHLLSGGDVLVEISSHSPDIQLELNGLAIKSTLAEQAVQGDSRVYRALITGLSDGDNLLTANSGEASAQLSLVNYPSTGPIFSGPHQQPYFCLNQIEPDRNGDRRRFAIGNGEFLDASATDEFCSLNTRVDYVYMSTDEELGFLPLQNLQARPQDMAFTETSLDQLAPYIVRIETGTINRAIYQIALLHDPAQHQLSALQPSDTWNERLVYAFGGGCEAGYFQANSTAGVLRDNMLSRGYAVVSSTLNVNAQGGCNDVISAETAMMVKEHFIESYGEPVYTIGSGGSGGAMQQLLIAGAYPGILDGLLPSMTFADAVTYFVDSQECASLFRDYVNEPSRGISDATKIAIGGWSMWSVRENSLGQRPKRIGPDDCSAQIPEQARYHAIDNPQGARCSIYDGMKNVFGEKVYPGSDIVFAKSPHDNVGVQYGLAALNEGLIDSELFLDLNENIGGWDIDVNAIGQRTVADEDALRAAYQTGRITSGGAGLSQVPIIDDRPYLDDVGNFHASVYSFVTRARLERDNGHGDNYIIRRHNSQSSLADDNLALMDQWLANIQADNTLTDKGQTSVLQKIVNAKPADLQDDCIAANGERIVEKAHFDTQNLYDNTAGTCNKLFPPHAGLRLVAGGPLSNDVLKCQLKDIDYADYKISFSDVEKQRLETLFASGVCDWSKPGVQQQVNQTWLSFGPSPVNRYQP